MAATDMTEINSMDSEMREEPGTPKVVEGKVPDVREDEIEEDVEAKEDAAVEDVKAKEDVAEEDLKAKGLVLKIDGEDWVDVAAPDLDDEKREPVLAGEETAAAPESSAEGDVKKEAGAATRASEGDAKKEEKTSTIAKDKEPTPKEGEEKNPFAKFMPKNMSKLKKKFRKRQIEGDTATKRAPRIKHDADKAYEKQYEVHTAHHEFDEKKPEQILDLCLIMDCTGSMSSWIEHCKETLHKVIDATVARDPNCKVRTAFVGYRDFCDGAALFDLHDFTYDADKVKAFISNCTAKGGGDFPEDVQGALRKALDLSWMGLDDSVKLAVFVADAPAHGRQYHTGHKQDDFPEGNPCGLILEDLMKEMSEKEILISLYQLNNQNNVMYDIMKKAHSAGVEKEGVELVDMRDIKPAPKRGPTRSRMSKRSSRRRSTRDAARSAPMRLEVDRSREMYSARTSSTIEAQCSKMRSSNRISSRRSCKSGW